MDNSGHLNHIFLCPVLQSTAHGELKAKNKLEDQNSCSEGFLNSGTTDILDQIILLCERLSNTLVSLASTQSPNIAKWSLDREQNCPKLRNTAIDKGEKVD